MLFSKSSISISGSFLGEGDAARWPTSEEGRFDVNGPCSLATCRVKLNTFQFPRASNVAVSIAVFPANEHNGHDISARNCPEVETLTIEMVNLDINSWMSRQYFLRNNIYSKKKHQKKPLI